MKRTLVTHLLLVAALVASPILAADPPAAGMSPEEAAMMEAYLKAATPGPMHELLRKGAGTYDLTITSWMSPDGLPQTNTGVSERTVVMDRFIVEKSKGESMFPGGPSFEGLGLSGYDNVSKEFFGTWMDNMGTGIMMSTGTYDEKARTFAYKGTYNDPMTGGLKTVHFTVKTIDDRNTVFEMYDKGPDGKEFKMMEIKYVKR